MNFECWKDLKEDYCYDEISLIGRDVQVSGKRIHFAAILKKGDQAELCMLAQRRPEPEELPAHEESLEKLQAGDDCLESGIVHTQNPQEKTNRDLLNVYTRYEESPKKLQAGDDCLEFGNMSAGMISTGDLGGMMLLMQLTLAGWQLPQGHPFQKEDWEHIELIRSQFFCPSGRIPEFGPGRMRITWRAGIRRYPVGQPVSLTLQQSYDETNKENKEKEELRQSASPQIVFHIPDQNGTMQEGICYIHKARLVDVRAENDQQRADPEYRKRMLEHLSEEEFAASMREIDEIMDQFCPRGMYFIAVEYECTLDLQLKFYTKEYLDAQPDMSGKAVSMMWRMDGEDQTGPHGYRLRTGLIQEPVPADLTGLEAELFEAYEQVPEYEEELEWI